MGEIFADFDAAQQRKKRTLAACDDYAKSFFCIWPNSLKRYPFTFKRKKEKKKRKEKKTKKRIRKTKSTKCTSYVDSTTTSRARALGAECLVEREDLLFRANFSIVSNGTDVFLHRCIRGIWKMMRKGSTRPGPTRTFSRLLRSDAFQSSTFLYPLLATSGTLLSTAGRLCARLCLPLGAVSSLYAIEDRAGAVPLAFEARAGGQHCSENYRNLPCS